MEKFLATVVYGIIAFLLCYYEKRKYGTILTPAFFLTAPFGGVLFLACLFMSSFGFYDLNPNLVYLWIFSIILFFFVGNFVTLGYRYRPKLHIKKGMQAIPLPLFRKGLSFRLKVFSTAVIALIIIALLSHFGNNGITLSQTEDFFSVGLWGHSQVVLCAIGIYSIGVFKIKDIWSDVIIIGIICLLFLANIKSDILLVLFSGLILRVLLGNMKFKIAYLIIAVVLALAVFISVYILDFSLQRGEIALDAATLKEILKHMFYYLFSGIGGGGAYIKTNYKLNLSLLFNPIHSVLKFLGIVNGEYNNIINEDVPMGLGIDTNVATLFGEVYRTGEIFAVTIFTVVIAILIYAFYRRTRQGHVYSSMVFSYFAALLVISLFGNPFWRLTAVELPAYFFVGFVLSKVHISRSKASLLKKRSAR